MGVEMLKKPSDAERVKLLESELKLEKQGRRNDNDFSDSQYSKLAKFAIDNCQGYCNGDRSVGMSACDFYDYDHDTCELKRFLGIDGVKP